MACVSRDVSVCVRSARSWEAVTGVSPLTELTMKQAEVARIQEALAALPEMQESVVRKCGDELLALV